MRYNGFLVGRHQRRPGARLLARARRRTRSSASPPRRCRRASATSGPSSPTRRSWPATRRCWVFPLAILLVFLVLAAQYESLTLPLAIILIVPMGLLAAMTGVWLTQRRQQHLHADRADRAGGAVGEERDPDRRVRARAGVRRAHAGAGRDRGEPPAPAPDPDDLARLRDGRAAAGASSTGAGAEMRQAMGVAVFAGMIGVTAFGLFLTPVFYVLLRRAGRQPAAQAARRGAACRGLRRHRRRRAMHAATGRAAEPHE